MSNFEKIYKVNSTRQLIDLNKEVVNFKLTFNTQSVFQDGRINANGQYDMIIVNQTELDSPSFEKSKFRHIKGGLGGEIVADKNVYQNYFMVLQSNTECYVKVNVQFNALPKHIKQQVEPTIKENYKPPTTKQNNTWKKKIWIGVGIVVVVLVCYYFYNKYKKSNKKPVSRLLKNDIPETPKSQVSIESNFSDKTIENIPQNPTKKLQFNTISTPPPIQTSKPTTNTTTNPTTTATNTTTNANIPSLLKETLNKPPLNLNPVNLSDLEG